MEWYIAKMIFHIETGSHSPQFDEQLRLIQAHTSEHALELAYQIGLMSQEEFVNNNGHQLRWNFIAVTEITPIGNIESGKEIHYQIAEAENPDLYLQRVEEKALNLKKIVTHHLAAS